MHISLIESSSQASFIFMVFSCSCSCHISQKSLFSKSLALLMFNFFSRLLFQLEYRKFSNYHFITCIKNPTRLLGWSFLQKQLTKECPLLFLWISPSQMFDRVFNRPLRWCIWCNLDGVFLIKFSTFSILFFYLYIGNFFAFILQHFNFYFEATLCPFYLFN